MLIPVTVPLVVDHLGVHHLVVRIPSRHHPPLKHTSVNETKTGMVMNPVKHNYKLTNMMLSFTNKVIYQSDNR